MHGEARSDEERSHGRRERGAGEREIRTMRIS